MCVFSNEMNFKFARPRAITLYTNLLKIKKSEYLIMLQTLVCAEKFTEQTWPRLQCNSSGHVIIYWQGGR